MTNLKSSPLDFCVSDYIALRFKLLGIQHIFNVPGDFVTPFLDVLLERHPDISLVTPANELIAGYATDAYSRVNGIGAVAVTFGVGSFSLLNAVAGAYVERNPVIVLNGCPSTKDRVYETEKGVLIHHSTGNLNSNLAAYQQVTVAAVSISDAASVYKIDAAIEAAYQWKKPVYIEVYKDVWQAPCPRPQQPLQLNLPKSDPLQLKKAVQLMVETLQKARNPLLWAGVELQRYSLQTLFEGFLKQTHLPYITTLLAKSVISENNILFKGVYTGAASEEGIRKTVNESDWIIGLGTLVTDDYLDLIDARYDQMIMVYDGHCRIGKTRINEVYLHDILQALSQRSTEIKKVQTIENQRVESITTVHNEITFNAFFEVVKPWVSTDWNVLIDESNSLYVASDLKRTRANSFFSEAAWGSIGYATPAAIGMSLATGQRSVVFAGDGGFHMIAQCLETLVAGTVVFVMNNSIFGIEQALIDSSAFACPSQFKSYNLFSEWNYLALATAFGATGYKVETIAALHHLLPILKQNTDQVSVVEVVIPRTDLPPQIARLAKGEKVDAVPQ